jgi:hypothetical protein
MATISKSWATENTILNAASVTTGTFSSVVDLVTNGYEGAVVTVDADFPASPTDDLIVEVYSSNDGTNFDDTPIFSQQISNGTDPNQITIVLKDLPQFKVLAKRSGSTDTITVTMKEKSWRWQSS